MKSLIGFALVNALTLSLCAAQGTVYTPGQQMKTSDIEALGRHADAARGATTAEQQKALLAIGAIGLEQTYLNSNWMPGTLTLAHGQPQSIVAMRLNLLGQVLEVEAPETRDGVQRYSPAEVTSFDNDGHSFTTLDFRSTTNSGKGFMEVVNQGRLQLLLLHETVLTPAVRNDALDIEIKPAYYQQSIRLFYVIAGQPKAQELELSKRTVLRIMGDQNKAVEAYATANNITYATEEDVLKLVEYYNKLNK